jgi:hypothetical protein
MYHDFTGQVFRQRFTFGLLTGDVVGSSSEEACLGSGCSNSASASLNNSPLPV